LGLFGRGIGDHGQTCGLDFVEVVGCFGHEVIDNWVIG
jgi:hypothetical protein